MSSLRTKSCAVGSPPTQYAVTQHAATEHPFDNDYWDEKREGIYVDITTGEPLFISTDKFDSGCGWPSFSRPIDSTLISEHQDDSHGMKRIEVRSKTGKAQLFVRRLDIGIGLASDLEEFGADMAVA